MKKRITYLDIAKCMGIFLIAYTHVLRRGELLSYLIMASVPLFFFLSGVTYHSEKSMWTFLKKKFRTLLIPYYFAGLVSIAFYMVLGRFAGEKLGVAIRSDSLLPNLGGLLYANSKTQYMKWNNSLWFLPCLFAVMLLVCCTENLLNILFNGRNATYRNSLGSGKFSWNRNLDAQENLDDKEKLLVSTSNLQIFLRMLVMALFWSLGEVFVRFKIFLPFQLETALHMFLFTEAGVMLQPVLLREDEGTLAQSKLSHTDDEVITTEDKAELRANRNSLCRAVLGAVSILCGCILLYLNLKLCRRGLEAGSDAWQKVLLSARTDEYGIFSLTIVAAFLLIAGLLMISRWISKWEKGKGFQGLTYVGRHTLEILLWNKFPILAFQTVVPWTKVVLAKMDSTGAILLSIPLSIGIILVCLLLGRLQLRILPATLGGNRTNEKNMLAK